MTHYPNGSTKSIVVFSASANVMSAQNCIKHFKTAHITTSYFITCLFLNVIDNKTYGTHQTFIIWGFPFWVDPRAQERSFPTIHDVLIFSSQLQTFIIFKQVSKAKLRVKLIVKYTTYISFPVRFPQKFVALSCFPLTLKVIIMLSVKPLFEMISSLFWHLDGSTLRYSES